MGSHGWSFSLLCFRLPAVLGFVIELYEDRGLQMSTAGVYLAFRWL
jgi:hypothetical protein